MGGVHSLNMYTRKRRSQSNHTRKRQSQCEQKRQKGIHSLDIQKRKEKYVLTVWTYYFFYLFLKKFSLNMQIRKGVHSLNIQGEGSHGLNIQEKRVDYMNIQELCADKKNAFTAWTYTKRHSQPEHTRKGIHSLNIQEKGVHSLNIQEKAVHSLNMHTRKRRLQSEHTQKRYSQSEHARIWNRITASILKQDPNTKRFKRTLTYYVTDTQYAKSYFSSCVRVEVAVLGCPS